jgi:prepilin-type N-terminal cleavage/methylation domain-containing protein
MSKRIHSMLGRGGYSLIEVLLVAAILGICLAIGSLSLARGLRTQVARGSAQSWQAAAAWAQILSLSHDLGLCGGDLGSSAPPAPATTNLARWRDGTGVAVEFSGALGSPDGGGSIYFEALAGRYRVVVRPGSGLTARTRVEEEP